MKTYLDCYPCFVKQALQAGKLAGFDDIKLRELLNLSLEILKGIPLKTTPAQIGAEIYRLTNRMAGTDDIYKDIKKKYNDISLVYYPKLKDMLKMSGQKLLTVFKISAAGNTIDFGAHHNFDLHQDIKNIKDIEFAVNDIALFEDEIKKHKSLMIIGDNCGEIVFDKILVEFLQSQYPGIDIVYSVRGKPVINDALYEDAEYTGLTKICRVITNGTDYPGTIINECSEEFKECFYSSDLIISKGQGNFETLEDVKRNNIFFVLKVKCKIVSEHLRIAIGKIVFKLKR